MKSSTRLLLFGSTLGALIAASACVTAERAASEPEAKHPSSVSAPVAAQNKATANSTKKVLTGKDALGDWSTDAPGVRRLITPADMPPPFDTPHVDNGPQMAPRPENAWPKAPAGFKVEQFATGLNNPRVIVTAPNGDPARYRQRWQAGDQSGVRGSRYAARAESALRYRVLPGGTKPAVHLCR
jgi:hypothetical protein